MTVRFPAGLDKEIKRQREAQKKKIRISQNTFIVELVKTGLGMNLQAGLYPSEIKGSKRGRRLIKEKIGERLIRLGKMTPAQAEHVLQIQKVKYNFTKRFGEIALELMYINRETLDEYLGNP